MLPAWTGGLNVDQHALNLMPIEIHWEWHARSNKTYIRFARRLGARSRAARFGAAGANIDPLESRSPRRQTLRTCQFLLPIVALTALVGNAALGSEQRLASGKFYRVLDGKVDAGTYNGFRRYNAVCSHCHGQDGVGSSFAPSLVNGLLDIDTFRHVVLDGLVAGTSIMKGFANDPNVAPYVGDIYAYLQARNDGALGRGRPMVQSQ
jgi:mono/diheme cytochrome c family protein